MTAQPTTLVPVDETAPVKPGRPNWYWPAIIGGAILVVATVRVLTGANDREILHINGTITGPFATVSGVLQSSSSALAVTYSAHSVNVRVARPGDASLNGTVAFEDLRPLNEAVWNPHF